MWLQKFRSQILLKGDSEEILVRNVTSSTHCVEDNTCLHLQLHISDTRGLWAEIPWNNHGLSVRLSFDPLHKNYHHTNLQIQQDFSWRKLVTISLETIGTSSHGSP